MLNEILFWGTMRYLACVDWLAASTHLLHRQPRPGDANRGTYITIEGDGLRNSVWKTKIL